jgi:hypothetical protein
MSGSRTVTTAQRRQPPIGDQSLAHDFEAEHERWCQVPESDICEHDSLAHFRIPLTSSLVPRPSFLGWWVKKSAGPGA